MSMKPNWLMVEKAQTCLMSRATMAMVEASSMLIVPMARQTAMAVGESEKKAEQPRKQVDAGGHHGGRMQQGAHRRGALHGVGQPGEQRKLGAFADDAAEDQQGGQRDHAGRQLGSHRCGIGQHRDVQGSQLQPEQHQSQQEGHVAGAGHHEGFFAGFAGAELVEPEPDEQVGGQPHQFPEDVKLQQRAGNRQGQHGPGEEGHAAVIAAEARIPGHVAQRVDLNQES